MSDSSCQTKIKCSLKRDDWNLSGVCAYPCPRKDNYYEWIDWKDGCLIRNLHKTVTKEE